MRARLSLEKGSANPATYALQDGEVVSLGRGQDNTIVLPDKRASKLHARIFAERGRWFIRDLDSRNGVFVDGSRVQGAAELAPGSRIELGDIRLCFTTDDGLHGTDDTPAPRPSLPMQVGAPTAAGAGDETAFQTDELTALYRFLSGALQESGPHGLIRLALETLLVQTRADLVGFRGLDVDDLLLVLPENAQVDAQLSGRMTRKALTKGVTVRLADPAHADLTGESLTGLHDALCVPLRDRREWAGGSPPLGALHAGRRGGAFTEQQVRFCEVLAGCLAGLLRDVRDRRALEADNSRLRLGSPGGDDALIGDSAAMQRLRDQISRLADFSGTLLITGETGVGKELIALGLHRGSRRRAGPLVAVNCASINPSTATSEFFGHAPGAFTNAEKDHAGFFQQADGGALFLDEIGELSLEMQGMLLRVLETHSFRPMKATRDVKVDVRVLAATNRDLEREIQAGKFRKDLFYRLSVSITAPPLREHLEDVPALAHHFLALMGRKATTAPLRLTDSALERLRSYSWPGNVRQLRYLLEGAAALGRDGRIDAADLHLPEQGGRDGAEPSLNLEELEASAIRRALERTGGNNTRAAELLGIHRDTLIVKVRKYGIARRGGGSA